MFTARDSDRLLIPCCCELRQSRACTENSDFDVLAVPLTDKRTRHNASPLKNTNLLAAAATHRSVTTLLARAERDISLASASTA
jgi:hypothetical protein